MKDKDNECVRVMFPPEPTGFPVALIVQIILAIISYLITKSSVKADKEYLAGLAKDLGGKVEID